MNRVDKIKFVFAMIATSFFLALATVKSVAQEPKIVFVSSLLMWAGYLTSHKISEGTFVDGHDENSSDQMLPHDREKWTGVIAGTLILISGFAVAITGLQNESLIMTFPAAILFWTGYIVTHYTGTGELL